MEFNLTIQEAIEAIEKGNICQCSNGVLIRKNDSFSNYLTKNEDDTWSITDERFGTEEITSKWAIYEESKPQPIIDGDLIIKGSYFEGWDPKPSINYYGKKPFLVFNIERFNNKKQAADWTEALKTFMLLKSHPLAVKPLDYEKQYFIEISVGGSLVIDATEITNSKLSRLSPHFNTEKDAEKAISDIGKEHILHMMRTFQGVYE